MILSIVLASIALYLFAGWKFVFYREKGRVRECIKCETLSSQKEDHSYYDYCSESHHHVHYDDPWGFIMLTWPVVLIHRTFWHQQPDIGERISARAVSAVEKEMMHVVVEGNGEQD